MGSLFSKHKIGAGAAWKRASEENRRKPWLSDGFMGHSGSVWWWFSPQVGRSAHGDPLCA